MPKKIKIFYFMHVDWDWIKQRPHFIAEGLSNFYEVHVFYYHLFFIEDSALVKNERNNIFLHPIIKIPFSYRNKFLFFLNGILTNIYLRIFFAWYDPEYVWFTFPSFFKDVPSLKNRILIYDCMDNLKYFEMDSKMKKIYMELETRLLRKVSWIFLSSKKLYDDMDKRGYSDKIFLINNAFDGKILDESPINNKCGSKKLFKIGYFGTISSWFDLDLLVKSTNFFNNIEYHIIGPNDMDLPNYKNIFFKGPVNHDDLYNSIKDMDCLIMPFKLDNLVLYVDPVKLYEYINFDKPIISIYYPEIERFSDFVYYYKNEEEFHLILAELIKNNFTKKYSKEQRLKFLTDNTWKNRTLKIIQLIEKN